MKIGQQPAGQSPNPNLMWIGALALVFIAGLIAGGQEWENVIDELRSIPSRIAQSVAPATDLPTLVVDMNFRPYNDVLAQREQALRDGVYIPSDRDFVTATIQLDGSTIPVRMRLLEGPADHLGDDEKWGFEVRTRQNQQLLDMQRFYLSNPAANNWLNEWAFTRALEREGLLAASYQFVHLVFNGADWGIYALQEGFANELLTAQGRPEGVIVRFDADLLWESIAHFQGDAQAAYADPIANLSTTDLQYFEVDAFRDAAIDSDPALSAHRDVALGLLRALQAGELKASQVFDVEQYGRFLALVDLWGATQATSLVNLHYYYNPASGRL
ncbi:MAG: CotH kinase family protein, partial [Chloroflexi bacterium]|nr:CotH kinase family protein [Chloroflexota bacterium]